MKALFLLISILLISCGAEDLPRGDRSLEGVGNFITADESLEFTEGEKTTLNNICDALGAKDSYFRTLVINSTVSADYSQKESVCDGESNERDISVEFSLDGGNLIYEATNDDKPVFKYVETKSNGSLADYCELIENANPNDIIQKQISKSQSIIVANVFDSTSSRCEGLDSVCAIVEYAFRTDDGRYRIEQAVKLTVNNDTDSNTRGMVVKKDFAQMCNSDINKRSSKSMSLKALN